MVRRLLPDLILALVLLILYLTKFYEYLPAPVQLVSLKTLLVSMAFVHATITRKVFFPSVDWNSEGLNAKTVAIIVIYAMFIYAYSSGG